MIPSIGSESRSRQYIDVDAHRAYGMKKIAIDQVGYEEGDLVTGVYTGNFHPPAVVCVTEIQAVIYALDRYVTVECYGVYFDEIEQKFKTATWRPSDRVKPIWRKQK